jgi:hypothetical protein
MLSTHVVDCLPGPRTPRLPELTPIGGGYYRRHTARPTETENVAPYYHRRISQKKNAGARWTAGPER